MDGPLFEAIEAAQADLRRRGDPAKAEGRKRYLKSRLEVLGCGVPDVRRAAKSVKRRAPEADAASLIDGLAALRSSPCHDDRLLAIFIAQQFADGFRHTHLTDVFHDWLGELSNWDTVDALSIFVIGRVALDDAESWPAIAAWTHDPWMWRRRASLLAHIPSIRAARLREAQLADSCRALLDETEFFIRKAVGWVIREISDRDPVQAEKLILELGPGLSALSFKEASRKLPGETQLRLRTALSR